MIPSFDQHRYSDPNCAQETPIHNIASTTRSGKGINLSFGNRSRDERSISRERRNPIFPKDPHLNASEGYNGKHLQRAQSNRINTIENELVRKVSSPN